ncbi:MAG: M28 family metallopeptidase [Bacteriovoracia bacterium]
MKILLGLVALTLSAATMAAPATKWLTVDNQILAKIRPKLNKSVQTVFTSEGASVVQLTEAEIEQLSHHIHHDLHRCGGFMQHDSMEEAKEALTSQGDIHFAKRAIFTDYSIDQQSLATPMVAQVQERSIRDMILKLSNFNTRYYKSETGVESSKFIRDTWANIARKRNDVKVELYNHKNWPQPSIIMTIEGSEKPEEIVVVGGHADSIAGFFGGGGKAPGADDNASGISTITEVIRILMNNNFKPKRTIKFMGYAAEEVGLLGSKEIASQFKQRSAKVIGVMQLDMTLRKGTIDKDIVMMSDYTNAAQNEFIGRLIDEYVKVPWGYSRCGYGCSDHASWTANGFPASIPFESSMEDINRQIHTARDTLESAGGDAKHAAKFARLATAFVVELAN